MNLTINLDGTLAAHLQKQASARSVTPEKAALDILSSALEQLANEEAWLSANRRRLELIARGRTYHLSAEESNELARLQAIADTRLEPVDRQLIGVAEEFRRLAEGLPDAP